MFGETPHGLIVPEEFGGDLLGGKNLVIRGGIQVNQEVAVLAMEPDWSARARPLDDATLAIVRIKVDAESNGRVAP